MVESPGLLSRDGSGPQWGLFSFPRMVEITGADSTASDIISFHQF